MAKLQKRQKTAFGEFLVQEIKRAGMSQEAFYNTVGIAKPTFYGLITAAPPPPDLQYRILCVLEEKTGKDPVRRNKLLDLAAQGRNEIPADIDALIKSCIDNWDYIRDALEKMAIAHVSDRS